MARATLRRVMLATEGTSYDAGAERIALALARALGATLKVVLPLVTNDELLGAAPEFALQAEAAGGATLRRMTAAATRVGVASESVVRRGSSIAHEILAAVAAHGVDLLITRRVGRRGLLARLLVGEMVSQVAAQAQCPVLMVPAAAAGLWNGRVLLAQSTHGGTLDSVALALAAGAEVPLERSSGDLEEVIGSSRAEDLVAVALQRADVASGRLGKALEVAIGAAPCPTLLVPVANDAHGRA